MSAETDVSCYSFRKGQSPIGKRLEVSHVSCHANTDFSQNKQIDVAMNTALEWNGFNTPNKKLSAEGQLLVRDLKDVIEKTKIMLLTKNDGNLIQDFVWQTQALATHETPSKPTLNTPVEKETAKQQGQEALEGLRTLGQLIITNGQFRKLCKSLAATLHSVAVLTSTQ